MSSIPSTVWEPNTDIYLANGSTVTPRLDYAYQGEYHTDAVFADSNLVKGYGLLNGRLTWRSADRGLGSGADWLEPYRQGVLPLELRPAY